MRRVLWLLTVVAGCQTGTEPEYVGRQPLVPPPEYVAWYRAVEECRGVLGDFGSIRWFYASEVFKNGRPAGAIIEFPNTITVRADLVFYWPAVRHEMDHHVTQTGDALHLADGGTACDGEH